MVEPTACAVHARACAAAVRRRRAPSSCSAPARSGCSPSPPCAATAATGTDRRRGQAPAPAAPGQGARRRRASSSPASSPAPCAALTGSSLGDGDSPLTGGADVVIDCVGSEASLAAGARASSRPAGRVVVVGMPGHVHARPHRRCGTARPASSAPTPTAPRRCPTASAAAPSTSPSSWSPPPTSAGCVSATYPLDRYERRHRPRRHRRPPRRGEDRLRPPQREGTDTLMPRPGFVLDVDRSTPPILFRHGEGFRLEKLPAGRSRVIYPAEPLDRARRTSTAPSATRCSTRIDSDPLPALLLPGMKLTIAFDDVSLPLPPMRRPDIRQRVIEAGARPGRRRRRRRRAPHRRPRPAPAHDRGRAAPRRRRPRLRRLRPRRPALQPRRRGPRQPRRSSAPPTRARRSRSTSGPPRATCSSTSTSTSSSMDGGWKSHRHRPGQLPQPAPPPQRRTPCSTRKSFMDQHTQRAALRRTGAWARCMRDAGVKVFQIETTLNTDTFPDGPFELPAEARVGVERRATGPSFLGMQQGLDRHARRAPARKIFQAWRRPHAA